MEEADLDKILILNVENISDIHTIQEEERMELGLLSVKYNKGQLKRGGIEQISTNSKLCLVFHNQQYVEYTKISKYQPRKTQI